MELKSSQNPDVPPELNGHYHFCCGKATVSDQQHFNNAGRKKSKVRLNDQLVPKPTDINMAEKIRNIATPKQHPYSSHISKFAMFPSFRSPDDPETGVRAAFQPFLKPMIPNSAPDITLMSKTLGNQYRHEIVESPMKNRKNAVIWPGEHGFFDHTTSLKQKNLVFYPIPPKTVLPNPKLRAWDLSLSERTSNMLKNLERTHWVTSYQMHYTGSGPANPLKTDDFKEQMSDLTMMNSHSASLRENSFPLFIPSKSRKGCRRRKGRSPCSPTAADLLNPSPASNQGAAAFTVNRSSPQDFTAKRNEGPDPNQKLHSQSKCSSALNKQPAVSKSFTCESRERENCKVQFEESFLQVSQSSQEANSAQITDTVIPLDLCTHPPPQGEMEANREKNPIELSVKAEPRSQNEYFKAERNLSSQSAVAKELVDIELHADLSSRIASEREDVVKNRKLSHRSSNPCILPRPPVLSGIHPVDKVGPESREGRAVSLLDFQNSFSKSTAHRNFNSSITHAAVNLRDNVVTGKKHDFYGINCYYLHG